MDEELEEGGDEEEEDEHQHDSDTRDYEVLLEADSDEEQVQANGVANKQSYDADLRAREFGLVNCSRRLVSLK